MMRIALLIAEFFSFVIYDVSSLFGSLWNLKTEKQSKKIPIVLLHGWFTRTLAYGLLKKRLENLGYTVYMPDFGWHLGKVEQLEQYLAENKIKKFIFIGHSFGGLIGLYYYKRHPQQIKKFITLGTPYYGTPFAYVCSFSGGGRQMWPHSAFLKKLHQSNVKGTYAILGRYDEFVPGQSAKLKGATHLSVRSGYTWLLFSHEAFQNIQRSLED